MAERKASSRRSGTGKRKTLMEVGDHVMLGSSNVDPVHWHPGVVLWTDWNEVLVQQYGIAMATPHKALHSREYVRAFGTREHCAEVKRAAEKVIRDAARQTDEVEELARELRRKIMDLFETTAARALASSVQAKA